MKKKQNQVVIKLPSRSCNESFARAAAAAFISQLDPTVDELEDIKTSVSEAVTNCIVHAYPDSIGMITMTIKILEPAGAEITVKDYGCGIPDIQKAREPMFTTGGAERSGMGFTIMESFMDKVSVRSAPGRGTTVKMRKTINTRGSSER